MSLPTSQASDWTPTPFMRWMRRWASDEHMRPELQQRWERVVHYETYNDTEYEWREVPLEDD